MTKSLQEVLVGLALVAVAVIALISISAGSESTFESGRQAAMTSKTFPTILASGLGILSGLFTVGALLRLIEEWRQGVKAGVGLYQSLFNRTSLVTVSIVVLLLAYAYLLNKVNFALLTFFFLFVGFFLFGQRRLLLNAMVSACGAAMFYGIFIFILELPLNP